MNPEVPSGGELDRLRERYAADLSGELDALDAGWREHSDPAAFRGLLARVHRLASSANALGFRVLGDTARALRVLLNSLQAVSGAALATEHVEQVRRLLDDLRVASSLPAHGQPDIGKLGESPAATGSRICLITGDPHLEGFLAPHLARCGYRLDVAHTAGQECDPLARSAPDAIVVDADRPESISRDTAVAQWIHRSRAAGVAVVFTSARDDAETRLNAARAGGHAYLAKPFDPMDLLDALERLQGRRPLQPYRVLIVDGDPHLSALYRSVLDHRGCITRIVVEPQQALDAITRFQPDLVMVDMQMSNGSGGVVAATIRQHPAHAALAIVLLASQRDLGRELCMLGLAGEDVLSKPLTPRELCGALLPRLRRARDARELNADLRATMNEVESQRRALERARDELEIRVRERTESLRATNRRLEHEIARRAEVQAALHHAKERAEVTLDSLGEAVITTDPASRVDYLNPTAESFTGWKLANARGRMLKEILDIVPGGGGDRTGARAPGLAFEDFAERTDVSAWRIASRDRRELTVRMRSQRLKSPAGTVLGSVVLMHQLDETRRLEGRASHEPFYDPLTGLVDREELERRIEHALTSVREYGLAHCLCYLDLDQFKLVNDTAGHSVGDRMLREIASLLASRVRERDTLARLGGDEFGLLLNGCPTSRAQAICESIVSAVNGYRFSWEGQTHHVGASIGIAPITDPGVTAAELLSQADVACYTAKDQGRNQVWVYETRNGEPWRRHGEIIQAAALRDAVAQNRFRLFLQPIRALGEVGDTSPRFEVLLRLLDSQGNLLAPDAFISAAERFGLMDEIDRWVIRASFDLYSKLRKQLADLVLAINLSGHSVSNRRLLDFVQAESVTSAVDPGSICFEITETAAVRDLQRASELIADLQTLGFRFALDDFGAGRASFHYLKRLPVNYLKIDGAFVLGMGSDARDASMVEGIHGIGHALGLQTFAECVESVDVLERLRVLGVDYAQGYAIGKPVPAETVLH